MIKIFTYEQILDGLILDIADCLGVEPAEIAAPSRFFPDLNGDSLEILDVTFRIQKRFGIRVHLQNVLEGWEVDDSGKLTAATVEKLSRDFPKIDWMSRVEAASGNPRDLMTVGLIAEIVNCVQTQTPDEISA